MASMKALVVTPKDKLVAVQNIPIPEPGPSEILIRVGAVALNRVDWLYTANPVAAQDRRVVGSDFAGVITKVGTDVEKLDDPRTQVGTRVAGFVQGGMSHHTITSEIYLSADTLFHIQPVLSTNDRVHLRNTSVLNGT